MITGKDLNRIVWPDDFTLAIEIEGRFYDCHAIRMEIPTDMIVFTSENDLEDEPCEST